MFAMAYDADGQRITVPQGAAGWRVRRMMPKGAPVLQYGREGLPLVVPLACNADDLRLEVREPGRYRLEPVDERGRSLPNSQAAYVYVHPAPVAAPTAEPRRCDRLEQALVEAMRLNHQLASAVIERFPEMLESAAVLLRAADGAGLPARASSVRSEREPKRRDRGEPAPGFDRQGLLAQLVPAVLAALGSFAAHAESPQSEQADPNTGEAIGDLDLRAADEQALATIDAELDASERLLMQAVVGELEPAHRRLWLRELAVLPVADAADKVRALLRGQVASAAPLAAPTAHSPIASSPTQRRHSSLGNAPGSRRDGAGLVTWGQARCAPTRTSDAATIHDAHWRDDRVRFLAILAELSAPQRAIAKLLATELRTDHRRLWLRELTALPFPNAVAQLRGLLGSSVSMPIPTSAVPRPSLRSFDAAPTDAAHAQAPTLFHSHPHSAVR
jgi:hypothetical protein